MHESKRYLGIDLAGAKNQKTVVAVLEHYPTEKKVFLLDIYERVGNDATLLELIGELNPDIACIGVNVPLDLPACIVCTRKTCPTPSKCRVSSVKWMRDFSKRKSKDSAVRVLEFTPYTQRPIELWVRYEVIPELQEDYRFEVDETLGGTKGPLTARMSYLKRHLGKTQLAEVWPKLSIAILANQLGIQKRHIAKYRQLEEGIHSREEILESLARKHGLFIYERDVTKLAQNLTSFDAFICAYTALLSDNDRCVEMPHGFPTDTGWVQFPKVQC